MKNKIDADSWFISYYNSSIGSNFLAKIEYHLGDEKNSKSHRFDTYAEAYQWIKNQVNL